MRILRDFLVKSTMPPSPLGEVPKPKAMRCFDYVELFRATLAGKPESYDAFQLIRRTVREMQSRTATADPDAKIVGQFYEVQNRSCTGSVFFLVHWPFNVLDYPRKEEREAAYKAYESCEILEWFPIDAGQTRTPTDRDSKALAEGPWGAPPYTAPEQVQLYVIEVSSQVTVVDVSAFQGLQRSMDRSGGATTDDLDDAVIFGGLRMYERNPSGRKMLVAIQWTRPPHETGLDTMVERLRTFAREVPPTVVIVHKAAGFFDLT